MKLKTNLTIQDAIKTLIQEKVLFTEYSSTPDLEGKTATDIGRILFKITPEASFEENYILRDDPVREKEVYNLYLINFFVRYMTNDRYKEGPEPFLYAYDEAVHQAIFMTNQRLYGCLKWLDDKKPGWVEPVQDKEVSDGVEEKPKRQGGTRLKEIYGYIIERSKIVDRNSVVSEIIDKFNIQSRVSAVSYFNTAIRKDKQKVVNIEPTTQEV